VEKGSPGTDWKELLALFVWIAMLLALCAYFWG
jgi:hypothetical protein